MLIVLIFTSDIFLKKFVSLPCFFTLSSAYSYQIDFIKTSFLSLYYEKNRHIKCSFSNHVCPPGNPNTRLPPTNPSPRGWETPWDHCRLFAGEMQDWGCLPYDFIILGSNLKHVFKIVCELWHLHLSTTLIFYFREITFRLTGSVVALWAQRCSILHAVEISPCHFLD